MNATSRTNSSAGRQATFIYLIFTQIARIGWAWVGHLNHLVGHVLEQHWPTRGMTTHENKCMSILHLSTAHFLSSLICDPSAQNQSQVAFFTF